MFDSEVGLQMSSRPSRFYHRDLKERGEIIRMALCCFFFFNGKFPKPRYLPSKLEIDFGVFFKEFFFMIFTNHLLYSIIYI